MKDARTMPTLYITADTETENGFLGDAICAQWCMFNGDFDDFLTGAPILTPALPIQSGTYDANDYPQIAYTGNPIIAMFEAWFKAAKAKRSRKVVVFLHNAHFDTMRIIKQGFGRIGVKEQLVNGNVIFGSYKYKGVRIEFRDTVKMLQGSLDQLARSYAPYLPKLDKDHYYGFTLNLRKDGSLDTDDITTMEDIEYAKRDVTTLKHVLYNYTQLMGVKLKDLKMTAPSQAFDAVKKSYFEQAKKHPEWKSRYNVGKDGTKNYYFPGLPKADNELLEKFYRGGRVLIREGLSPIDLHCAVSFDETSAYPFCMANWTYPLPGKKFVVLRKVPKQKGGRFLVEMMVENYQADLPILPYKPDWTNQKTPAVYPRSVKPFATYITDTEYDFYLTQPNNGTHIIINVYYWSAEKCHYWLEPFVTKFYKQKEYGDKLNKENPGSGDAYRTTAKLMLNSAYGKFGQKYVTEDTAVYFNDFEKDQCDEFKDEPPVDDHRNFHIAAMITGAARVRLYEAVTFFGVENNVYSDTDSIKILAGAYIEKGAYIIPGLSPDALGGWKYEGRYDELVVKAPKQYSGIFGEVKEDKNGVVSIKQKVSVKAKGLPMADARMVNDQKFNFLQPKAKREAEAVRMEQFMHNLFKSGGGVDISYNDKPVQPQTFAKEQVYAKSRIGSSTDPNRVTGYHFDGERFQIHVVGVTI